MTNAAGGMPGGKFLSQARWLPSTKRVTRRQRVPTKEIGGGEALAAFDLDFEEVQ